ncbi:hypothetical protein TRAPUB_12315 [Trametes pubescens]|uniref:Uncharacterized protein n=1 Tax=Trametes pubescens TaxID=154538 RepID=A0A1M2VU72_TRAPU|nr:hypothetical protein TRAPUB_12315 [Trametes pubescens]
MANTRPTNPTTRPGLVVAPKPRRRAGEAKKAKEEKKIAKERKEASARETKDKLANLEVEIVQQQQAQRQLRSQHSKDVKKDPQKEVLAKRKCAPSPEVSETEDLEKSEVDAMDVEPPEQPTLVPCRRRRRQATPVDDESSDLTDPEEDDEPVKKKPKAPKNALRLTVEAAKEKLKRATVPASTASAHSDSAFSADTATTKQQSRVHHWAANVKMASPNSATTSSFSSNSVPRTLSIPATPYAAEEKAVSTRTKGKKAAKEEGKMREARVKAEPGEDAANLGYGATEDEAPEAEAAKISPLKNGERLTSTALVKCEPVDLSTPGRPKKARRTVPVQPTRTQPPAREGTKSTAGSSHSSVIVIEDDGDDDEDFPQTTRAPRNTAKNSDLPQCATANNTWRRVFIPTLLAWLGSLDNPWLSSDIITVATLRKIWDAVYGADSPYTIVANDRVCGVVSTSTRGT